MIDATLKIECVFDHFCAAVVGWIICHTRSGLDDGHDDTLLDQISGRPMAKMTNWPN